jgi:hypothetical protein
MAVIPIAYKYPMTGTSTRPLKWGTAANHTASKNLVLEDQINIGSGTIDPVSSDPLALNNKAGYFDAGSGNAFQ